EVLPQKARPAFNLICSYLRTDRECFDLADFSMCSPFFRAEVIEFMGRDDNRPGLESVKLNDSEGGLNVEIALFPTNLPFYDIANLDWERFERSLGDDDFPIIRVVLNGPDDPIIEQVSALFSSPLDAVILGSIGTISEANLSLSENMLRNSSIDLLYIDVQNLDEITAPLILSIASHTKIIRFSRINESQVADPAAFIMDFINQIDSLPIYSIKMCDNSGSSSFFDIPNSFWEIFFNQKLSNSTVNWVKKGVDGKKITKAPIDWTDVDLEVLN
ncbi:hypothetical protein PMAYCL1PPCAC_13779, partial [Pristionchus mayeri]